MIQTSQPPQRASFRGVMESAIRIGAVALLVLLCARVVLPFADLLLWALVLAVALYPMQQSLAARLGGREGRAAGTLVLVFVLLLGTPMFMLGGSFAEQVHSLHQRFENHTLAIPGPSPSVERWPLVGKRVYGAWSAAAENLPEFVQRNRSQLGGLVKQSVAVAANTAGAFLLFIASLIIAGIVMAYGDAGSRTTRLLLQRLTSEERGSQIQRLATATVRSVATGVVGVAFLQALLLGVGFIMAGIPGAGILAVVALMVGILQLPGAIIALPAIGFVWWSDGGSTTTNVLLTVYFVAASMADNVLKPLLLGRGVDTPMPVILIGAIGGMISGGIVGLFIGSVVLAIGYELLWAWLDPAAADLDEPTVAELAPARPHEDPPLP